MFSVSDRSDILCICEITLPLSIFIQILLLQQVHNSLLWHHIMMIYFALSFFTIYVVLGITVRFFLRNIEMKFLLIKIFILFEIFSNFLLFINIINIVRFIIFHLNLLSNI